MSEVEKHYAVDGPPEDSRRRHHSDTREDAGPLTSAAAAAQQATGRVREAVGEAVDHASAWSRERYGETRDWASDTFEEASRRAVYARRRTVVRARGGRRAVEDFVEENPIMVGVVGLAAGLLAGALLPRTRHENRYFGRYADEVRDQGLRYVQDVAEQGRHLMEENLDRLHRDRDGPRRNSDRRP